jgi:hypothetical protein
MIVLHRDKDGLVWQMVNGVGKSVPGQIEKQALPEVFDFPAGSQIRVLGTPGNAGLIWWLFKGGYRGKKLPMCDPSLEPHSWQVLVGNPAEAGLAIDPASIMVSITHSQRADQWHELTVASAGTYLLMYALDVECLRIDCLRQHCAWPVFAFLYPEVTEKGFFKQRYASSWFMAACRLLTCIGDPRWYSYPGRLRFGKLYSYLGLTPETMKEAVKLDAVEQPLTSPSVIGRRIDRALLTTRAWYLSPNQFFKCMSRRWPEASMAERALRTSRKLVQLLRLYWIAQLRRQPTPDTDFDSKLFFTDPVDRESWEATVRSCATSS